MDQRADRLGNDLNSGQTPPPNAGPATPMRILFFTTKLNLKNAGGSVPDLDLKVRDLIALGHDVSVVTVFSRGNDLSTPPPYPIIEERIPTDSLFTTQPAFRRLLQAYEGKADVFHVEGQFLYGAGLYRLLGGRTPIVAFFNRELVSWPNEPYVTQTLKSRCRFLLEKHVGTKIANRIDAFVITSPYLRDALRAFGLRDRPTLVLPDFVNAKDIRRIAGTDATPSRTDGGICTLMCTGRMIPEKGFDAVLNAFALLERKERFRLIMGGNGPEEGRLRALSAKLGLDPYVTFTGWIEKDQMLRHLADADIFILPKWRIELTSVILFEAMSLGKPSIVMAGGGLEWLVGDAGLAFPMDDVRALADRIMRLADDRALQTTCGENAMKRMQQEFDHATMAKRMEELVRQTAEKTKNA